MESGEYGGGECFSFLFFFFLFLSLKRKGKGLGILADMRLFSY